MKPIVLFIRNYAEFPEYNRFLVGHRISWNISDNLILGASETLVRCKKY